MEKSKWTFWSTQWNWEAVKQKIYRIWELERILTGPWISLQVKSSQPKCLHCSLKYWPVLYVRYLISVANIQQSDFTLQERISNISWKAGHAGNPEREFFLGSLWLEPQSASPFPVATPSVTPQALARPVPPTVLNFTAPILV